MDLIKRPKQVQRAEKAYLSNEKYQDFSEQQFKNIYEYLDTIISKSNDSSPIGTGMDYYGLEAPEGYMFADGSAISRTEYSELFKVIGTMYGIGDGVTTFNLPDKRERVSVMHKEGSTNGTSGALLSTIGSKGGEFEHQLTKDELPNITGTLPHIAYGEAKVGGVFSYYSSGHGVQSKNEGASSSTQNSSHYFMSFGSNVSHNNLQPYLVCNYIIKVK